MPDERERKGSSADLDEHQLLLPAAEDYEYPLLFHRHEAVFVSPKETKLYKRRWAFLILLASAFLLNGFQNIQYSGLQSNVAVYYQVSAQVFDLLTQMYYFAFVVCFLPATWVMKNIGLRWIAISATVAMLTGEGFCLLSASRRSFFWAAVVGQLFNGVAQVFLMSVPILFSVTWFEPKMAATASSILLLCFQLGNGLALVLPPIAVPHSSNMDFVGRRMNFLFCGTTTFSCILVLLILFVFPERPPLPPSQSQAAVINRDEEMSYLDDLKILMKNCEFIKIVFCFGLNSGAFNAITTFVGPDILKSHTSVSAATAGEIGSSMIFVGAVGMIASGFILDRTKTFLVVGVIETLCCFLTSVFFAIAINYWRTWTLWLITAFLGYFLSSFTNTGSQISAELTYPVSESHSTSIIMAIASAFSMILIAIMRQIMKHISLLGSNIFFSCVLFIAFVLMTTVNGEMKRTAAERKQSNNQ
ncbi:choline/ethanolamine transporter flvcr2a-like isoform X2 [Ciona intestinalis]